MSVGVNLLVFRTPPSSSSSFGSLWYEDLRLILAISSLLVDIFKSVCITLLGHTTALILRSLVGELHFKSLQNRNVLIAN